jgi:hypothetical protein
MNDTYTPPLTVPQPLQTGNQEATAKVHDNDYSFHSKKQEWI